VLEIFDGNKIVEAWDSKFGKTYFRDELEELADKIENHSKLKVAGFVSNLTIERKSELAQRIEELELEFGVKVHLLTFKEWLEFQLNCYCPSGRIDTKVLATSWLNAYMLTLGLRKVSIAPIDEPCQQWVSALIASLESQN